MTGRRTVVTGIGVVAPGGVSRDRFWKTAHRGPHRHPADQLLRPVGVPVADRRRVRLRPGRGAGSPPQRDAGADRSCPVRRWPAPPRRWPTAGSTLDRRRPGPGRGRARQRGRRHHRPGAGVRRRQRRRPATGWSTTARGGPYLYHALVPSTLAAEVACRPARTARRGGLHRLHLRHRRDRARRTS